MQILRMALYLSNMSRGCVKDILCLGGVLIILFLLSVGTKI